VPAETNFRIELPGNPAVGLPALSATFGRMNVILGSNGTGKSKVLRHIRDSRAAFDERSPVYIEGGRVINIPQAIAWDHQTFNEFGTLAKAQRSFKNRRLQGLATRVRDAFFLLERKAQQQKIAHSDAVVAWTEGGMGGPCPPLGEDPLLGLFRLFSAVFPEITITLSDDDARQIQCRKRGGAPYSAIELSDGERQVLFTLADIALSAEPLSLVVVDEPELNLNPLLANRLWDTIESHLPDAVFVYGTHSISFAMRRSIDAIVALKGNAKPALQLSTVHNLDPAEAKEFLGAIPAILSANAALITEGEDDSFDSGFYRWVLGTNDVAVVPIGGSSDVLAAARRAGVWHKLSADVAIAGVIDRDFKSSAQLPDPSAQILALEYHEAESYLCQPSVVCAVASALGTADPLPTGEGITDTIVDYFRNNLLRVAINRTTCRAIVRLNVSLQSSDIRASVSEEALKNILAKAAREEAMKARQHVGEVVTLQIFDQELALCKTALQERSVEKMLQLAPGKELLPRLAPLAGCKDSAAFARAVYKHLAVDAHQKLKDLREKLTTALDRTS
jgi:ABC-type branched-subunit amino acid transport system ATPase component